MDFRKLNYFSHRPSCINTSLYFKLHDLQVQHLIDLKFKLLFLLSYCMCVFKSVEICASVQRWSLQTSCHCLTPAHETPENAASYNRCKAQVPPECTHTHTHAYMQTHGNALTKAKTYNTKVYTSTKVQSLHTEEVYIILQKYS